MSLDAQKLRGALAVTRFGLGARPGEILRASSDPQGWLLAQIRPSGADQPVTAPFPIAPTVQARLVGPVQAGSSGDDSGRPAMLASTGAMEGEPTMQPALMTFVAGAPLPSMRTAFESFSAYRQEIKAIKGDPAARRAAVTPILMRTGEEILARTRLAASTDAGFRERWTLFWANHFTVAAKGLAETAAVGPFEREAIRPHVFGRFEDLLVAASSHPGMLLYLDQTQSIGPNSVAAGRRAGKGGLNENLGREILELHTVGAGAGYTQSDVTEFARALTGWSMGGANGPEQEQGAFLYRANFHEPGERVVMGRRYPDKGGDQALEILKDLAADPHTADHIARKLAIHFIADDPQPSLVAKLRGAFLASHGDLSHVATVLVAAPEAWDPTPRKFKTPYEYLVSSYRAADVLPIDPAKEIVQPLNALGMRPFSAPQPNGWSELAADWAAPDAIVKRLTWAQAFADSHAPAAAPADEALAALGARLSPRTATAISRAETRQEAFALLLMSPEFQRR